MYELDYEPERLDWNEYFTLYKETRAIKYYMEFLHFYEPVLDRKTRRFIDKYEIEDSRAEDLKQIFSFLLWEELQNYKLNISKLPFDITKTRNVKMKITESKEPIKPANRFDDELDEQLKTLAGL